MIDYNVVTIYDNNYSIDEILNTNLELLGKLNIIFLEKINKLDIIKDKTVFIDNLKKEDYHIEKLKTDVRIEKKKIINNLNNNLKLLIKNIKKLNYKKNKVLINTNYLDKLNSKNINLKIFTKNNINNVFQVYRLIFNNLNKDLEELRVAYNINISFLKKKIKLNQTINIINNQLKKINKIITNSYIDLNNFYLLF